MRRGFLSDQWSVVSGQTDTENNLGTRARGLGPREAPRSARCCDINPKRICDIHLRCAICVPRDMPCGALGFISYRNRMSVISHLSVAKIYCVCVSKHIADLFFLQYKRSPYKLHRYPSAFPWGKGDRVVVDEGNLYRKSKWDNVKILRIMN